MVIDSKGNLFEERRKKDRRKNKFNVNQDKREKKDRRSPENKYKP